MSSTDQSRLLRYGLMGLPLAFLGLPLYLYLPKFYADQYGISLTTLGLSLMLLRLVDLALDPLIGMVSDRLARHRTLILRAGAAGLAVFYLMLFMPIPAALSPLLWFVVATAGTYLFYSLVTINYYAAGMALDGDTLSVSAMRERFILLGTLLASLLPAVLTSQLGEATSYMISAVTLCVLLAIAAAMMPRTSRASSYPVTALLDLWRSAPSFRLLLLLFFVNALPVAITSTLFLFFVESVLDKESSAGLFLGLYFLAAIVGTFCWTRIAAKWGNAPALLAGFTLSVVVFIGCALLTPQNADLFYVVCAVSGFALGADMVIVPAMLANQLGKDSPAAGTAFALWHALGKLSLAMAAGVMLPLLGLLGYHTTDDAAQAGDALRFGYAVVPCVIKCFAILITLRLIRQKEAIA